MLELGVRDERYADKHTGDGEDREHEASEGAPVGENHIRRDGVECLGRRSARRAESSRLGLGAAASITYRARKSSPVLPQRQPGSRPSHEVEEWLFLTDAEHLWVYVRQNVIVGHDATDEPGACY